MDESEKIRLIVESAIFSAIVFVFTIIFVVAIPATSGYWNIGEAGVYIAAIMGGPIVGFIAGGLGSALADIATGYASYAPFTFVIKGLEGLIVGYLSNIFRAAPKNKQKYYYMLGGILMVFLLAYISIFSGYSELEVELYWGLIVVGGFISFIVPVGVFLAVIVIIIGLVLLFAYLGEERAILALACIIGGLEMIFGYFIVESYYYGWGPALVEAIMNFLQVIAGVIISIPVTERLEEMGVIARTS